MFFIQKEEKKLSQIRLHNGSPQRQETHRAGNDFLSILLQVPFGSNRWSAPGQCLRTNVNLTFKARYAEQEKQVYG